MSFLFKIFQKKAEDDESVLSALVQDIQKRQSKLDEIRQRERRTTFWASIYLSSFWVVYVAVWYFGRGDYQDSRRRAGRAVPVVVGPIVIMFIRRIVQAWFNRKGEIEEKTLRELRKTQQTKIEEIKKKTNYYSTRDLLQRYDQSSGNSPMQTPRRPNDGGPSKNNNNNPQKTPVLRSSPAQLPPSIMLTPPVAIEPPRRQWYDKLADAVLGDEGSDSNVPRYALICEKCFAHNGLVKESVWEETQYVCPKCNHFNPSMRAKKEKQAPRSSMSPVGRSPKPRSPEVQESRMDVDQSGTGPTSP